MKHLLYLLGSLTLTSSACYSDPALPPYATSATHVSIINTYGHVMWAWQYPSPEVSDTIKSQIMAQCYQTWPNATYYSEPTNWYNCHAYAFGTHSYWYAYDPYLIGWLSDGLISVTSGNINPTSSQITTMDTLGCSKIYYYLLHTGIYVGLGKIRSKWGCGPLAEHVFMDCPYSSAMWTAYRPN